MLFAFVALLMCISFVCFVIATFVSHSNDIYLAICATSFLFALCIIAVL